MPVADPLMVAVSYSGAETNTVVLAEPVPAGIVVVTKPTGFVVAFWADALEAAVTMAKEAMASLAGSFICWLLGCWWEILELDGGGQEKLRNIFSDVFHVRRNSTGSRGCLFMWQKNPSARERGQPFFSG